MTPTAQPLPVTPTGEPLLPDEPWVAIIANPFSGSRANQRLVDALAQSLASHGMTARVIWDRRLRRATLEHPDLARHCACIVAAGGDGTAADVFNERSDIPLAVLPLGNENLLAKHFGFTGGPDALARAIRRGDHRTLDLGRIENRDADAGEGDPRYGRRFSLMLGAGLDAEVVRRVAAWRASHPKSGPSSGKLRRVRRLSYALPAFAALGRYGYPPLELDADGLKVRGAHVFVFNLPAYAMNLPFAPESRGDDGLLDWVVFEKPGSVTALNYLAPLLLGRALARPDVRRGKATRLRITSTVPAPVQIDGDAAGLTPVEIGVLPNALKIIAAR
jgi:diacylglycerol kinase (ATP)